MSKSKFDTRHPLESFDPRYRSMLRSALTSEITLSFDDINQAKHFQTRIQMYRKCLLEVNDPEAKSFYRLKTSRKDNVLRIYPADAQFSSLFDQFVSAPQIAETTSINDELNQEHDSPSRYLGSVSTQQPQELTFDELFADITIDKKDSDSND